MNNFNSQNKWKYIIYVDNEVGVVMQMKRKQFKETDNRQHKRLFSSLNEFMVNSLQITLYVVYITH